MAAGRERKAIGRVGATVLSFVLLTVSLCAALVVCEFVVRHVAPQGVYRFPTGMFVLDEATQYRLKPGFKGVAETTEYRTEIRVNGAGLREDHDYGPKRQDVFRILAIGDSFTMGVGVEASQAYMKLQEQLAPAHAGRYEVINGGVPGYSPGQSLAYLEKRGLALQPDLVVLSLFVGNDIIESYRQLPFYLVDGYLTNGLPQEGMLPPAIKLYLQGNSHLYQLVWPMVARVLHPSHNGELGATAQDDFRAMYSDASDTRSRDVWKAVESRVARFEALARAHGFAPVIAIVPEHKQVDAQLWSGAMKAADSRYAYRPEAPGVRIAELCRQHNIPAIDLLDGIRNAGALAPLYFDVDGHFTVTGNAVTARVLSGFLAREVLAAKSTPSSAGVAWTTHASVGEKH